MDTDTQSRSGTNNGQQNTHCHDTTLGPTLLSPQLTCTSLNAFGPCVIEICVNDISAFLEPSSAASATAEFTGFLDSAALGAYGTDPCSRRYNKRRHRSA